MKEPNLRDELTTKMHEEFQVTEEMDKAHTVLTVREAIRKKLITKAQALKAYNLSDADLDS